jgi:hypothetical protein
MNQEAKIRNLYLQAHRARAQARIISATSWEPVNPDVRMLLQMLKTLAKLLEDLSDALVEASKE